MDLSSYKFIALSAHELDANEIENFEFSLTDSDHLPIDDFDMIKQWKSDSSFKVIIDLKVSRKKVDLVAEVCVKSNFYTQNKVSIVSEFLCFL